MSYLEHKTDLKLPSFPTCFCLKSLQYRKKIPHRPSVTKGKYVDHWEYKAMVRSMGSVPKGLTEEGRHTLNVDSIIQRWGLKLNNKKQMRWAPAFAPFGFLSSQAAKHDLHDRLCPSTVRQNKPFLPQIALVRAMRKNIGCHINLWEIGS